MLKMQKGINYCTVDREQIPAMEAQGWTLVGIKTPAEKAEEARLAAEAAERAAKKAKDQAFAVSAERMHNWFKAIQQALQPHTTMTMILHSQFETMVKSHFVEHLHLGGELIWLKTSAHRKPKRFIARLSQSSKILTEKQINAYDEKIREAVLIHGQSIDSVMN